MRIVTLVAPALALLGCRPSAASRPLRLGTTTTVLQSGMLALAESLWTGAPLAPVIGPSGQILHAAAQGDLDVALTHAPALEAKLLAGATGLIRCPFVTSRFAIVGPANDPAQVATAVTAARAMERIAGRSARFVSRGDSSGTHERELALWRAAGIEPHGRTWYIESGADQTTTLRIADERQGYALADLPTFARVPGLALHRLFDADTILVNRYTLYRFPDPTSHPAAPQFLTWALDTWRARVLALHLPDGTPAFEPPAGGEPCTTS
ncbi:MAG TPA: substrate-binding domain-containing protein [Gemmatimonadales bacterium]|nr:substrate-binding domain-containing protein [Gemmatimonadales bacterium]